MFQVNDRRNGMNLKRQLETIHKDYKNIIQNIPQSTERTDSITSFEYSDSPARKRLKMKTVPTSQTDYSSTVTSRRRSCPGEPGDMPVMGLKVIKSTRKQKLRGIYDEEDKENVTQGLNHEHLGQGHSPYGTENLLKSRRRSHVTKRGVLSPLQTFSQLCAESESEPEEKQRWCSMCKSASCDHIFVRKIAKSIHCPTSLVPQKMKSQHSTNNPKLCDRSTNSQQEHHSCTNSKHLRTSTIPRHLEVSTCPKHLRVSTNPKHLDVGTYPKHLRSRTNPRHITTNTQHIENDFKRQRRTSANSVHLHTSKNPRHLETGANNQHLQACTNRKLSHATYCSMCKTSSCEHLRSAVRSHSDQVARSPCCQAVRSPCDGASNSPDRHSNHDSFFSDNSSSDLAILEKKPPEEAVLPVADILLNRLRGQGQGQSKVLGRFSLRGLDGTDLSLTSMKLTQKRHDSTAVNIHDISKIQEPLSGESLVTSLRERTSNSDLHGALLHSTFNYPLHSTLNNAIDLSVVRSVDSHERTDFEVASRLSPDFIDETSTDSSEFSFDVDETVPREMPPRPQNPAIPTSDFTDSEVENSDMPERDYNANLSSPVDMYNSKYSDFHPKEQIQDYAYTPRMRRQRGSRELQEAEVTEESWQDSTVLASETSQYSDSLSYNSQELSDNTLLSNTILGDLQRTDMENPVTKGLPQKHTENHELDKTVKVGCIGLLKRQKQKQNCQNRPMQTPKRPNSDVSHAHKGLNCYGGTLQHNTNLFSSLKKTKIATNLTRSQTKRKREDVKSLNMESDSPAKRLCARSNCGNSPQNRRLSEMIRKTKGAIHYELDSQLNVIRSSDLYPGTPTVSLPSGDRKRQLVKKMKSFNETVRSKGSLESFGNL